MAAPSVSGVRQAIAANLDNIDGLRVTAFAPDKVSVPAAAVAVERIEYDLTFDGGFTGTFRVRLYASKADDRSGQEKLDAYLDDQGALSVKAAIEANRDLDGAAGTGGTCRVTAVENYGVYEVGGVEYVGADLLVTTWATGS